jgi:hypothetical protein
MGALLLCISLGSSSCLYQLCPQAATSQGYEVDKAFPGITFKHSNV